MTACFHEVHPACAASRDAFCVASKRSFLLIIADIALAMSVLFVPVSLRILLLPLLLVLLSEHLGRTKIS